MVIQTDVAKTFWNLQNYLYEIEKQNIKNTHYYLEPSHKAPKFLKNSGSQNGMNGISSWSYSSTQYWLIKDGKIISASHEIINISDEENIFVIVYNCSDGSGRFSSYQEFLDITYYCNELEYKKFNDIIEELNIQSKLCDTIGDDFSNRVSTCPNCSKKDEEIIDLRLQIANLETGMEELKAKLELAEKALSIIDETKVCIEELEDGGCAIHFNGNYWEVKETRAEILAMLKEPDAEIASLKARIKELDDALSDSQAHLAWAEQDSRALSELRQAARELINLCNGGFVRGDCNAINKLEALLEKP